jgi:hypothetical protein
LRKKGLPFFPKLFIEMMLALGEESIEAVMSF